MKKIGIVTIYKVNNYGAELQAYATQKVLQLMGYDAEIINYTSVRDKKVAIKFGNHKDFLYLYS